VSSEATQGSSASRAALTLASVRREPLESAGLVALILLAPAVLVYLSFNSGGYFPSAPAFVAIVLAQALVLRTTLATRPFEGFTRVLAVPLVALALYAAWQLTSALWSHATARTLDSYDRTLLYVLALTLFGSLRYSRRQADWLLRAVVAGLAAVCLVGLISRTLPHTWPTASSFFNTRLSYPLTYWNAEGMLAVIVLILGFHLCADRDGHWSVRVLAAALLPAIAATLLLTFSRGALGAAVIGLLAYCVLTRVSTLPTALLAVVPASAIALHSAWDATLLASDHPTSPQAVSEGRHVALVVGLCMLGAGLLRAALLPADRRLAGLSLVRAPPARAVRVGVGTATILVLIAIALLADAGGFAHREYEHFVNRNAAPSAVQTRDRLTDPANNGRLPVWRTAVRVFEAHPLRGAGAGTFQQTYFRDRTEPLYITDAHSLYLQSLTELGLVGFVLMLLVVLGMLGGLAARIRGPARALYAALFAATLAWALHQAFDWDWQMPAATLGVFILAGMALSHPREERRGRAGLPAGRTLVALGWLLLAVAPLLIGTSYARVQRSGQDLKRQDCVAAKHEALSSLSLSVKRPQAYTIIGVCDLEGGFAQAAVAAMAQAASLEAENWEGQYWLAVARAGAGIDPRPAINRALVLNPLEPGLALAARQLGTGGPRQWERLAPLLRREALGSGQFSLANL
jgi:O-antigen ligase